MTLCFICNRDWAWLQTSSYYCLPHLLTVATVFQSWLKTGRNRTKDWKKKNWKRVRITRRHSDKRSSEREGQTCHGLEVGRSWWTCDAYPLPEELRNPPAPWLLCSSYSSSLLFSLLKAPQCSEASEIAGMQYSAICTHGRREEEFRSRRQTQQHTTRETLRTALASPRNNFMTPGY